MRKTISFAIPICVTWFPAPGPRHPDLDGEIMDVARRVSRERFGFEVPDLRILTVRVQPTEGYGTAVMIRADLDYRAKPVRTRLYRWLLILAEDLREWIQEKPAQERWTPDFLLDRYRRARERTAA